MKLMRLLLPVLLVVSGIARAAAAAPAPAEGVEWEEEGLLALRGDVEKLEKLVKDYLEKQHVLAGLSKNFSSASSEAARQEAIAIFQKNQKDADMISDDIHEMINYLQLNFIDPGILPPFDHEKITEIIARASQLIGLPETEEEEADVSPVDEAPDAAQAELNAFYGPN
jgi:hypothetical protein